MFFHKSIHISEVMYFVRLYLAELNLCTLYTSIRLYFMLHKLCILYRPTTDMEYIACMHELCVSQNPYMYVIQRNSLNKLV